MVLGVLCDLFKTVNEAHARQMVILGALVSVPIVFVNVLNEIAALVLESDADFLSVFEKPQVDALAYRSGARRRDRLTPPPTGSAPTGQSVSPVCGTGCEGKSIRLRAGRGPPLTSNIGRAWGSATSRAESHAVICRSSRHDRLTWLPETRRASGRP